MWKTKRWVSKKYRQWVSEQPCILSKQNAFLDSKDQCKCSQARDPHHVKVKGYSGLSRKPDDTWCVPLCHKHHHELEHKGKLTFEKKYNVDLIFEVLKINQQYIIENF